MAAGLAAPGDPTAVADEARPSSRGLGSGATRWLWVLISGMHTRLIAGEYVQRPVGASERL